MDTAAPTPPQSPSIRVGRHRAFEASLAYFLGPIRSLVEDPSVSEIMVNGPRSIYVERQGRVSATDLAFDSDEDLLAAANNIAQFVGHTLGPDRPIVDARLADGSRVCIVLPPIAAGGISITIRRFSRRAVNPEFLLGCGAITPEAMELLLLAVACHQNIIVSGGTGSGKTTLLNVLSTAFSDDDRVLVIEDTQELQVQKRHVVNLVARPPDAHGRGEITIRDLFITSLRMRPDRIIVGEVRRAEAIDMIQAMTSGHRGSLATLHASTPQDACRRLETMALMANLGIPLFALRSQIASAVDLVVQTVRASDGRRLISHISEVRYDEQSQCYGFDHIFELSTDAAPILRWTGRRPSLAEGVRWQKLDGNVRLTRRMLDAAHA